jgi:hypothetical protein
MSPLKEETLLQILNQNGFHVSIRGYIPDDINLLTEEWLTKNVDVVSIKTLTLSKFIEFWKVAEEDSKTLEYFGLRKSAYPSIIEQLDMMYWDKVNGTNIWQKTIEGIKKQFPKK